MKSTQEVSAIELIEEALALLRKVGLSTLVYYWLGTFPFIILFLSFWSDMANDAFADRRLSLHAVFLSLGYGWMKFWQADYMRRLRYTMIKETPPVRSAAQKIRSLLFLVFLQPTQWLVLPVSKLLMVPFGYVHAFYESVMIVGDGTKSKFKDTICEAWQLSVVAPKQNHLIIWLLSPWMLVFGFALVFLSIILLPHIRPDIREYSPEVLRNIWLILLGVLIPVSPMGVLIFANIALIVIGVPYVMQTLVGVESAWVQGANSFYDPFFLVVCLCLTFVVMDPFMKLVYVIRDFYGGSQASGADLMIRLNRFRGRVLALLILLVPISGMSATEVPPPREVTESRREFSEVVKEVSMRREFTWKAGRKLFLPDDNEKDSVFKLWLKNIRGWGKIAWDWISDVLTILFKGKQSSISSNDGEGRGVVLARKLMEFGIVLLLMGVVVWVVLYLKKRYQKKTPLMPEPVIVPDLESHKTLATDLPADEWERLARSLMEKGEWRLAARAWYLSGLRCLHGAGWIAIRRGKSNADYLRETHAHSQTRSGVFEGFTQSTRSFERVWYGFEEASSTDSTELEQWLVDLKRRIG